MPLESNAAGDFHLIESGMLFREPFTDPLLSNWTIDQGVLGTDPILDPQDLVVDPADGGSLTLYTKGLLLRYTGPIESPTLALPMDHMVVTGLEFWNPEGHQDDRTVALGVTLGCASSTPWQYYHATFNYVWFGPQVNYGYAANPFGPLQVQSLPAGLTADSGPAWLGLDISKDQPTPEGCGGEDCLGTFGPGVVRQCTQQHSDDWPCVDFGASGGFCETENYGLPGYPGISCWNNHATNPATDFARYYEMWGWRHQWIEVQCIPEGYYLKVVRDAGITTSHPTYSMSSREVNSNTAGPAQTPWVPAVSGYTNVKFCIYGAPNTAPRFHRLEVRKTSDNSLLTYIEPRVGVGADGKGSVTGGDVYSMCPPGECSPLSLVSFYFMGGSANLGPAQVTEQMTEGGIGGPGLPVIVAVGDFNITNQTVEYRANTIAVGDGNNVDDGDWLDSGFAAHGYHLNHSAGTMGIYRETGVNGNPSVELAGDQTYYAGPTWLQKAFTDFIAAGGSCTIFALLKQTGGKAQNTIIDMSEGGGNPRLVIHATYNDTIYFDAGNTSTARLAAAQPSGWNDNWHVLTCWRDGADMAIRVDGVQIASRNNASGGLTGSKHAIVSSFWGDLYSHQGHLAWVSFHDAKLANGIISQNEAVLANYAGIVLPDFKLLLETDDAVLLETGDNLLREE